VGLVGLVETKVKMENVNTVANSIFGGWQWAHNFHLTAKGRIWVAWRQSRYTVTVEHMTEQCIRCHAIQLSINRKFFITYVYGFNQEINR